MPSVPMNRGSAVADRSHGGVWKDRDAYYRKQRKYLYMIIMIIMIEIAKYEVHMTVVSAVEARRTMGKLLNIVLLRHEDVVIERDGKPIARLTTCDDLPGASPSSLQLDIRSARGLGRELWKKTTVPQYIEEERSSWE